MFDMYRENILDHAQNPRHYGLLEHPDIDHEEDNPLCGDHIHMTLRVGEDNRIEAVGWEGDGCAISQASASMLGEVIVGKTLDDIKTLTKEDLFQMLGIQLSMNRVKCALLSLKVLKVGAYGLAEWQKIEDADE